MIVPAVYQEVLPVNIAFVFRLQWADVADPCCALCESTVRRLCSRDEFGFLGFRMVYSFAFVHRGLRVRYAGAVLCVAKASEKRLTGYGLYPRNPNTVRHARLFLNTSFHVLLDC